MKSVFYLFLLIILQISCTDDKKTQQENYIHNRVAGYAVVKLNSDLSKLSESEKKIIPYLIEASQNIDSIFWLEVIGTKAKLCTDFPNEDTKKLFEINYGPWDRLEANKPFMDCLGKKPLGAMFYPTDITGPEFEKSKDSLKDSPYSILRRDTLGKLFSIPYHIAFENFNKKISNLLIKASEICENKEFRNYLQSRAKALISDNYTESDTMWLSMKSNRLDFVVGPVEILEDQLFNIKADHQAFLLMKDIEWSDRIKKYTSWLPFLQKTLPVDEKLRAEEPGFNSDIFIYDVLYCGGSGKAGPVTISTNIPFNPQIQIQKGIRNLQFKNVIKAKFENIVLPISEIVFEKKHRVNVKSEAFFTNVLFAEMGKTLGIRNTINNKGSVRQALKEQFTISENIKSYVLGLFLIEKLREVKEINNELIDFYSTYIANVFRIIRLGITNPYAKANIVTFNYLVEKNAIEFTISGHIKVNEAKMNNSIKQLTNQIITMQGNGDYEAITTFITNYAFFSSEVQKLVDQINKANIPYDITLKQGIELLGIQ